MQILVELSDHLARLQALAVRPEPFDPPRQIAQESEIAVDYAKHVRAQHLDGNLFARMLAFANTREVHLSNRRAGYRRALELHEHFFQRAAQ